MALSRRSSVKWMTHFSIILWEGEDARRGGSESMDKGKTGNILQGGLEWQASGSAKVCECHLTVEIFIYFYVCLCTYVFNILFFKYFFVYQYVYKYLCFTL